MTDTPVRWLVLLAAGLALGAGPAYAQSAAPTPATPSTAAPSTTPGAPTVAQPSTPAMPAPSAAPAPGAARPAEAPSGEASGSQPIEVPARPALIVRGASNWDDGFKKIAEAIARARAAALKAGLKEVGRPLAAFVETDDNGFKFEAMIPIEAAPTGAVDLPPDAKIGTNPGGKALKFQHRGAYDDIDSTYEAITAYLDEKGLEARNVFVEEYLNEPKGADDTALALDIYVFIK